MWFVISLPVLIAWIESGKTDTSDDNMYSLALLKDPEGLQNWTLSRRRSCGRFFISMGRTLAWSLIYRIDSAIDSTVYRSFLHKTKSSITLTNSSKSSGFVDWFLDSFVDFSARVTWRCGSILHDKQHQQQRGLKLCSVAKGYAPQHQHI